MGRKRIIRLGGNEAAHSLHGGGAGSKTSLGGLSEIPRTKVGAAMRVELTTLRLFAAVAEERNIAHAASREHIAASAVSTIAIRAVLADAGNSDEHQRRVPTLKALRAEVPVFQLTRSEIFYYRVACLRQAAGERPAFHGFQVQRDAFLIAGVNRPPKGLSIDDLPPSASGVSPQRRFNLDHLGAEISQQSRGERSCDEMAELQDSEAVERSVDRTAFVRRLWSIHRRHPYLDSTRSTMRTDAAQCHQRLTMPSVADGDGWSIPEMGKDAISARTATLRWRGHRGARWRRCQSNASAASCFN
jgi:hypothetical protein